MGGVDYSIDRRQSSTAPFELSLRETVVYALETPLEAPMTCIKLAALLLLAAAPKTDEAKATTAAKEAVTAWLKLADSNQLEKTWDESGAVFKAAITRADWARQLGSVRGALGKLKSRELKSATFTRSLPGVPEGEYVVTQWEAKFENKAGIETITASHEKDGGWKVVGYFIK